MRLVAGVVRVTADLERIVKYAFRISPMFGSCSFDFGIWIVAPSVSKMSRSQLNYAASRRLRNLDKFDQLASQFGGRPLQS